MNYPSKSVASNIEKLQKIQSDSTFPKLESFKDIYTKKDDILNWCHNNPIDDHIYEFKNTDIKSFDTFKVPDMYIAGSFALHNLLQYFKSINFSVLDASNDLDKNDEFVIINDKVTFVNKRVKSYKTNFNWDNNDIDLFILNRGKNSCNKISNKLDIIQCTDKSIESLLLRFDLPVCRVALDFDKTLFISIQALSSIFTRKMNIPYYLKERYNTCKILKHYISKKSNENCIDSYITSEDIDRKPFNREQYNNSRSLLYTDKFYKRVDKYNARGFSVNWVKTDDIVEWIKLHGK